MKYSQLDPCPALEPYIERYYLLEEEKYLFSEIEINCRSNCYTALVLNFGDNYRTKYENFEIEMTKTMLSGLSTLPYSLFIKGKVCQFGVVFKGAATDYFFKNCHVAQLVNKRVDLEKCIGSEAEIIWNEVNEAIELAEKVEIIEGYLLQKLNANPVLDSLFYKAATMIYNKHGMITIETIINTLGVSDRHLRRVFKESLGISPKLFIRIKRFNYVHYMMTNDEKINWHEFIDEGGYYDQAHFIKDFIEFCGKAPSAQLLKSRLLTELWETEK